MAKNDVSEVLLDVKNELQVLLEDAMCICLHSIVFRACTATDHVIAIRYPYLDSTSHIYERILC